MLRQGKKLDTERKILDDCADMESKIVKFSKA